ncbi:MAG TPA: amidohydrolase [Nocardioidaceae bacterium]|nr:amidohydrolase [Nocardioidaceae bacterium]
MALLFTNGPVFDGHQHLHGVSVLVEGNRMVAVGPDREVRERAGGAEEVDLAGGLLVPGFTDAHMHPMVGGLERLRCEMYSLSSADDYLDAIKEHAAKQPYTEWFRGGGWSVDAFPPTGPTAELLDRLVPDRPAFLPSSDHHDAWVNSLALKVAGITKETPDPPDGWFERDEQGRPTGTVREAAMALVQEHITTSREEYHAALLEAQAFLHSWGITGWHDALIGGYAGIDDPTQAYLDVLARGELTARVRASQWWDRHRGVEQVEQLEETRRRLAGAGLDAGSVKVMVDGIGETFTAAVTEPYLGDFHCRCGDRGLAFLDHQQLYDAVTALDAAGFQAHFHAIGDRAVHDALDAVERARRANGLNDHRHQIAHMQLVRPEDRPRFRRLSVAANLEGMWVRKEAPAVQLLLPHLDAERIDWHYPFADIAAAGAHLAGGSDWPVNPPEPISAIHALVNRRKFVGDEEQPETLLPEQGLTLAQALGCYTSGSAFVNHSPDTGTIQVGARADLAVLDRDPFAGPLDEIGAATVVRTVAAGQVVFSS